MQDVRIKRSEVSMRSQVIRAELSALNAELGLSETDIDRILSHLNVCAEQLKRIQDYVFQGTVR